jgi:esterase
MKLNHRILGEGEPLLILHGLFGSSDNWQTLGKQYAEDFQVILVDQRDHGHSSHSHDFSYEAMAEDLNELIEELELENVRLLGHSMGGKTCMLYASEHPETVKKMVIADIAPKKYPVHHQEIIAALEEVDLSSLNSRKEVEAAITLGIPDFTIRQFLLKSLYWIEKGQLAWRFNVPEIARQIEAIVDQPYMQPCDVPVLFVAGGKSDYIREEDHHLIEAYFLNSSITAMPESGHWLHADNPETFYSITRSYLLDMRP